jgi:hypothetical protein
MSKLSYDPSKDVLIHVGDLIAKGDKNEEVLQWMIKHSIQGVRGNHDQPVRRVLPQRGEADWFRWSNGELGWSGLVEWTGKVMSMIWRRKMRMELSRFCPRRRNCIRRIGSGRVNIGRLPGQYLSGYYHVRL